MQFIFIKDQQGFKNILDSQSLKFAREKSVPYRKVGILIFWVKSVVSFCFKNFEKVSTQCLLYSHETEMNWGEAEWFCRWNKAELILLKDKESQNKILDFFSLRGIKRSFWVGGYVNPDSKWHWIDGTLGSNATQLVTNE